LRVLRLSMKFDAILLFVPLAGLCLSLKTLTTLYLSTDRSIRAVSIEDSEIWSFINRFITILTFGRQVKIVINFDLIYRSSSQL
jgi:hypothetical protein